MSIEPVRHVSFRDRSGRQARLESRRFVSMADPHHAGLEWTLVPEDWSRRVEVVTAIEPFTYPATLFVTPDHYVTGLLHADGVGLHALGVGQGPLSEDAARAAWRLLCEPTAISGNGRVPCCQPFAEGLPRLVRERTSAAAPKVTVAL